MRGLGSLVEVGCQFGGPDATGADVGDRWAIVGRVRRAHVGWSFRHRRRCLRQSKAAAMGCRSARMMASRPRTVVGPPMVLSVRWEARQAGGPTRRSAKLIA